ncbi:MAG TPA: hypothetical protein VHO03_12985 [Ignavibacteriales bacterium]|nr:hypothetical protein [Ignavibacteriales bacterium]
MKTFLFLSFAAFIFFVGCEKTQTLEPDSIYKQKTVVFASLKKDSLFAGVTFTRTLPLNEPFDIKKAELKDVMAYLKIDGVQVIPLIYIKDGLYKPRELLSIHSGSTYELFAKYGEKTIYARTRVPESPQVLKATLVNNTYIEAQIAPKEGESYGAAWFILGASQYSYEGLAADFFEVYVSPENLPSSTTIRTADFPEEYRTDLRASGSYLKVFSFDKGFYDYFRTRGNNLQVHNSFTQGGSQIIWNVYGNDVIGLFMGSAAGKFIKAK